MIAWQLGVATLPARSYQGKYDIKTVKSPNKWHYKTITEHSINQIITEIKKEKLTSKKSC